jgi:hypothetical protein
MRRGRPDGRLSAVPELTSPLPPTTDDVPPAGPTVAVLDIDGVLADVRHRLHHLARRPKDWDAFFAAASGDPALPEGFAVARTLAEQHRVVYLSGRPERLRQVTSHWLADHDAPPGRLLLRRDGDHRPARQVKLAALRRLGRSATVAVVVDDDPAVCVAVEQAGFPVFRATWGLPDGPASGLDGAGHRPPSRRTLLDAQENDGRT